MTCVSIHYNIYLLIIIIYYPYQYPKIATLIDEIKWTNILSILVLIYILKTNLL